MVRKSMKEKEGVGEIIPRKVNTPGKSLRNIVNDELKKGLTQTEITINIKKNNEKNKVSINSSYYNTDAVIAKYAINKNLSKENETTLIEASKMDDEISTSNHKAYSVHAYVASNLYYPEITNNNIQEMSKKEIEKHITKIHDGIEKILNNEEGNHETYIAQYTDKIITEASKIRKLAKETKIEEKIKNKNIIKKLENKGYVFIRIAENEYVDSHSLTLAKNKNENMFVFLKGDRVILRALNGKIKNGLYKTLNEEEMKYRKNKTLGDDWNGSEKSGGSPMDGTKIPIERVALILSLY